MWTIFSCILHHDLVLLFAIDFYFDDKHWSQALFHEDLKLQCQWKVPLTKGGTSLLQHRQKYKRQEVPNV